MKNNITDFDIKKSYVYVNYPFETPTILIDEYWEHYMDIFGQEEKYENFKKNWNDDGFKSYKDFADEYRNITNSINFNDIFQYSLEDVFEKAKKFENDRTWMHLLNNIDDYMSLNGKYLQVDLHHAFETVFSMIDAYKPEYNYMSDVIASYTSHSIFNNIKTLRVNIYNRFGLRNQILFDACGGLLKKIFESNHPVIKTLNERYKNQYLSKGDMYLYKINDGDDISGLTGDFEVDGILFSIKCMTYKKISILDNTYLTFADLTHKTIDYNISKNIFGSVAPEFIQPILLRLIRNEQPTEKDLAIGYEDQIFFHLNENDYKIL